MSETFRKLWVFPELMFDTVVASEHQTYVKTAMNSKLFPPGCYYESAPITELRGLRLRKIAEQVEDKPQLVEAIATHWWNKCSDLARSFPTFGAFRAYCRAVADRDAAAAARALRQMHDKRIEDALVACSVDDGKASVDAVAEEAWRTFLSVRNDHNDFAAFRATCRARVSALARGRAAKTVH